MFPCSRSSSLTPIPSCLSCPLPLISFSHYFKAMKITTWADSLWENHVPSEAHYFICEKMSEGRNDWRIMVEIRWGAVLWRACSQMVVVLQDCSENWDGRKHVCVCVWGGALFLWIVGENSYHFFPGDPYNRGPVGSGPELCIACSSCM